MEKEINYKLHGLCYRCEHRACFIETGAQPRMECGDVNSAVGGCYMYKPVKPIVIGRQKGDKRPITLGYFSARVRRSDVNPNMVLVSKKNKYGELVYWVPKTNE